MALVEKNIQNKDKLILCSKNIESGSKNTEGISQFCYVPEELERKL